MGIMNYLRKLQGSSDDLRAILKFEDYAEKGKLYDLDGDDVSRAESLMKGDPHGVATGQTYKSQAIWKIKEYMRDVVEYFSGYNDTDFSDEERKKVERVMSDISEVYDKARTQRGRQLWDETDMAETSHLVEEIDDLYEEMFKPRLDKLAGPGYSDDGEQRAKGGEHEGVNTMALVLIFLAPLLFLFGFGGKYTGMSIGPYALNVNAFASFVLGVSVFYLLYHFVLKR